MTHTLRARIEAAGLGHRLDDLEALCQRSVRLLTTEARDADLPRGASKLGGRPDLPADLAWPARKGRPLAFLGQLNLADVAPFPAAADLPSMGLLSLFYDAHDQPGGVDPDDKDGWRVLYLPHPPELLQRRHSPQALIQTDGVFAACSLHAYEAVTLPPSDALAVAALGLDDEEWDQYHDLLFEQMELHPHTTLHQLLGHPDVIQGDMQVECELAATGMNALLLLQDPAFVQSLAVGAENWRLLLQLDSDDRARMMWGDCGRLYVWIRADDLATRAFDRAWVMLQCF